MRISFCENRLIHMAPPEGPKPPGDKPQTRPAEEIETGRQKRRDLATEPASELKVKVPSEAENRNKELKEKAKTYYEELLKAETPEKIEELRKKAESDDVTLIDLQGGWEWLGVTEAEQEKKFATLGKIYLEKLTDKDGEEVFKIKPELNQSHKVKYGIGAAHLLPPSIQAVEITDKKGHSRRGKRKIEGDRIGYYDENGYIPIFGGYKIKPLEFFDETSGPYKNAIEEEKKIYIQKRDAASEFEQGTSSTSAEVLAYTGARQDYPISTLKSLRKGKKEDLETKVSPKETAKIDNAQKDLTRIEMAMQRFDLKMNSDSEINGGIYLVALNGRGAQILGYTLEARTLEADWLNKIHDPSFIKANTKNNLLELTYKNTKLSLKVETTGGKYKFSKPDGAEIEKIDHYIVEQAANLCEETETVKLIRAMQNNQSYEGFKFSKNYDLNLTHLLHLYYLSQNKTARTDIFQKIAEKDNTINPEKLIARLFQNKTMNIKEAEGFAKKMGMELLTTGEKLDLNKLRTRNKRGGLTNFNYNWNAHSQFLNYGGGSGALCCAYMVSTILGIPQKEGVVGNLVSRIMRGNEAKYGSAGIVYGLENFKKGDVVTFSKRKDGVAYGHVAIVRDTLFIDGKKFVAIQHDMTHIQLDLVPVNQGTPVNKLAAEFRKNKESVIARQKPEDQAKLREFVEFRKKYVNSNPEVLEIEQNAGYFGDSSKTGGKGNLLFAVRTDWSNEGEALASTDLPEITVPKDSIYQPAGPAAPGVPKALAENEEEHHEASEKKVDQKTMDTYLKDLHEVEQNLDVADISRIPETPRTAELPKKKPGTLRVIFWGDTDSKIGEKDQVNLGTLQKTIKEWNKTPGMEVDFAVSTGDHLAGRREVSDKEYKEMAEHVKNEFRGFGDIPFSVTIGNHDLNQANPENNDDLKEVFKTKLQKEYQYEEVPGAYSYKLGNATFVVFNNGTTKITETQISFFNQQSQNASGAVYLLNHIPPFQHSHGTGLPSDKSQKTSNFDRIREIARNNLESKGKPFYMVSGHDHFHHVIGNFLDPGGMGANYCGAHKHSEIESTRSIAVVDMDQNGKITNVYFREAKSDFKGPLSEFHEDLAWSKPEQLAKYTNSKNPEIASKTSETHKSKLEKIEASSSPTGFPVYIDYPNDPALKSKPPKYILYLHGDHLPYNKTGGLATQYVENLRSEGQNAILIFPEADPDPKKKRNKSWESFNKKPSPLDKIIAHCKKPTGEGTVEAISFSGGYRALGYILKNSSQKFSKITMLDSTYKGFDIENQLINYSKNGGKLTLITQKDEASVTNQTARNIENKGKSVKLIKTNSGHSGVNLGFLQNKIQT